MRFEDVLTEVGVFGRFQKLMIIILCLPRVILPLHFLLHIFISAVPPHRCAIPQIGSSWNSSQREKILMYIPKEADGSLSPCKRYSHPQLHLLNSSLKEMNESLVESCEDGYEYDLSTFSSTTVTQVGCVGTLCD
ncbi:hypothetical protein GDO86_010652 [Hymenochirus boettgeri]|uniref:Uncharacterized protein n=1 Tax=Hymenochirus boettgeri TaxID=247094 RepID=A0A8T2JRA8_9PIPI|nr:hypothetical protein GDO86_010652 [Hymenochirus boettgeri]